MRSFLLSCLLFLVVSAGASLPATAGASDHVRNDIIRDRSDSVRWSEDRGPRTQRRRLARATYNDFDDEPVVRSRRPRADGSHARQHQRYTKRQHARTAKHARRHQHASRRQAARRQAARRQAQRRQASRRHAARKHAAKRRVASPAWTKRSLSTAGPKGSGSVGVASYYWQGTKTATGARYQPDGISAAHRTLPFGTRVRVTHLGNGRSVDLRINDRGPYIGGRIIDLSRGAAKVIGMTAQGLARVRVTILGR